MLEYHAEVIKTINDVYPINVADSISFESYCRVAALSASKKIINIPSKQEMFYHEALNDFLSSHIMINLGSSRVALTALRAIIENFLYYFYYIDHPVEFDLWKKGDFRIKFSELFDYLKKHPKVIEVGTPQVVENLQKEYATLSMAVHGSSDKFMMTAQDNFPHIFQAKTEIMSQWNSRAKSVFICIMKIIFSFYKDSFITVAHKHERKIISLALGVKQSTQISSQIGINL